MAEGYNTPGSDRIKQRTSWMESPVQRMGAFAPPITVTGSIVSRASFRSLWHSPRPFERTPEPTSQRPPAKEAA